MLISYRDIRKLLHLLSHPIHVSVCLLKSIDGNWEGILCVDVMADLGFSFTAPMFTQPS